jgi:hypothetical protein
MSQLPTRRIISLDFPILQITTLVFQELYFIRDGEIIILRTMAASLKYLNAFNNNKFIEMLPFANCV